MTTTTEMEKLLKARYSAPEWGFLLQVRNSTGFARTCRTADAIAMGLYPSRGLYLHGFEIKVSRADWVKESRNPEKADEIAKYCDFWWIAIADAAMIQPGELPEPWGLLVPKGGKLYVVKEAKKLDAEPLTRPFLAAIMRRVSDTLANPEEIRDAVRDAIEKEREHVKAMAHINRSSAENSLLQLQASIVEFERASGVNIRTYDGGRIGEAVKLVMELGIGSIKRDLQRLRSIAQGVMTACDDLQACAAVAEEQLDRKQS